MDSINVEDIQKKYSIDGINLLIRKIKMIKLFGNKLDVETLDIDTARDVDKFNNQGDVSEEEKNVIRKLFRVTRKDQNNRYKNWYYQFIQMYKNVLNTNCLNMLSCSKE